MTGNQESIQAYRNLGILTGLTGNREYIQAHREFQRSRNQDVKQEPAVPASIPPGNIKRGTDTGGVWGSKLNGLDAPSRIC